MSEIVLSSSPPTPEAIEAAWRRVQLARHPERPRTLDLVPLIFDDFEELQGDRAFRDDPAIVGGPALLEGRAVMVIGHQKGKDTESKIIGEGGSGGALAIGVGDEVLALENATYSVISPEGCAAILWRAPEAAPTAAAAMRMTAADQLELGVIDGVIDEPGDGAHSDHAATAIAVKQAIMAAFGRITRLETEALLTTRYARLRGIGLIRETEMGGGELPGEPSLRRRIGRLLHLPGIPRRPRWSEIWPSGEDADSNEEGA